MRLTIKNSKDVKHLFEGTKSHKTVNVLISFVFVSFWNLMNIILKNPNSPLKVLWLTNCFVLTSDAITVALNNRMNRPLRALNTAKNKRCSRESKPMESAYKFVPFIAYSKMCWASLDIIIPIVKSKKQILLDFPLISRSGSNSIYSKICTQLQTKPTSILFS